jgi:deoxyribodipyrimidine photo-lyase
MACSLALPGAASDDASACSRRGQLKITEARVVPVPEVRVECSNDRPLRADGDFVLYWMIAFRRTHWNFALDHAISRARELKKPLVLLEALRCDYPWASDRMHRFVLEGMAEKSRELESTGVYYYPYVERSIGEGKGLLAALANQACLVITDDFPCFFIPHMIRSAAKQLSVPLEKVDSNGFLPLRAADQVFSTAYAFRRFLQKNLPVHLSHFPEEDPLAQLALPKPTALPTEIMKRWPPASLKWLESPLSLAELPINHKIAPAEGSGGLHGGEALARAQWHEFLGQKIGNYGEVRNQPEQDGTSGLSPYLHFGHISAHEMFHDLMAREKWSEAKLAHRADGSRQGWWGVRAPVEQFLDQMVTWREVGFNFSSHREDYDRYESLPDWARATLARHSRDERQFIYSLKDFAAARTHDPLWNAAQRQLSTEGRMHNYMRMLWGKKILEWSETPEQALETLIELNNRYAIDGRNPNSYSGIFWCLGRYDRPWGPERPIFGRVRYMSSENTARKLRVKDYLRKYGEQKTLYSDVQD